MQHKHWIAVAAIVFVTATLHAAEPVTPSVDSQHVFSFGAGNGSGDIEYRYMFHDSRLAAVALVGYDQQSNQNSGAFASRSSFHRLSLGAGLRNNFMTREQLRPFVQLDVQRLSFSGGCGIFLSPNWIYEASGGGEYFLGKRLSLEGRVGVESEKASANCSSGGINQVSTERFTGTFRSALAINFYF